MALIFPEHRSLNVQNIDITNSPLIKLRDDPQQTSFFNIPFKDVTLLFVEGSKTENEESPFSIPVNNIWGATYAANKEELEQLLISPHLHIPRIYFSVNPNTALKLSIQYIFQLAYGVQDMDTVIQQLVKTDPSMFKHFETFNGINIKIWKGQNCQIPSQLPDTFGHQILSARSQILTQTGKKYLYFTHSIRKKVGMFLDDTTPLKRTWLRRF